MGCCCHRRPPACSCAAAPRCAPRACAHSSAGACIHADANACAHADANACIHTSTCARAHACACRACTCACTGAHANAITQVQACARVHDLPHATGNANVQVCPGLHPRVVFVSKTGKEVYHRIKGCSGAMIPVALAEVEGRRLCKKCIKAMAQG